MEAIRIQKVVEKDGEILMKGLPCKKGQEELERELRSYGVAWPSPAACNDALSVFSNYYLSHGLEILDALIGQMAVAMSVAQYTFNKKHYSFIHPQFENCLTRLSWHRSALRLPAMAEADYPRSYTAVWQKRTFYEWLPDTHHSGLGERLKRAESSCRQFRQQTFG